MNMDWILLAAEATITRYYPGLASPGIKLALTFEATCSSKPEHQSVTILVVLVELVRFKSTIHKHPS